ncbi:hypothetical protein Q8F55_002134 [Vanrija albida]|uniref:Uncharacterized protein n=1 Tax=Vanrija albida TaxID=181172 RepID=A0ABR3Q9Z6_9TREE
MTSLTSTPRGTTAALPTTPRLSSNKENSVGTPSPARKSALRGLGAPASKRKAAKPYERKSSVARAKLADAESKHLEAKPAAATTAQLKITAKPGAAAQPKPAKPATITAAVDAAKAHLLGAPCLRFSSAGKAFLLPKVLPRPPVREVAPFLFGDTQVPAAYVLDTVRPVLPEFLASANEYRPYPTPECAGTPWRPAVRFGLPRLLEEEVEADVAEYIATRRPDVALAFATGEEKGSPMRVVPAKSLAFAAQCAYFPKVLPELCAEDRAEDDDSESDDGTDSEEEDDNEPAAPEPFVSLPLHKLVLPSPATFDLLSTRLHHAGGRWQAALLGLKAHDIPTPSAAAAILAQVPAPQLKARLDAVFGVWMNMVALGVDDDAMWNELGGAWAVLVPAFVGKCAGVAAESSWGV